MVYLQEEVEPKITVLVDNDWCRLEVEEACGLVSLHWPRLEWSIRHYRAYLQIFETVKKYIRALGYDKITVFLDKEDKRVKLIKLFGFERQSKGVYELWVQQ